MFEWHIFIIHKSSTLNTNKDDSSYKKLIEKIMFTEMEIDLI